MRCPGCNNIMTPVPLGVNGEVNQSYRCYQCGGFWIEGWLVNRVNSAKLDKFPELVGRGSGGNGNGKCPVHGLDLVRYSGDSMPSEVEASRCITCGWWWFGGNNLFKFKPAQEAKINYFKLWGKGADLKGLLLPVGAVVVIVLGLLVGVKLAASPQNPVTKAMEKIIK